MNILYISPMIVDHNNLDGVARKLLFQCDALAAAGVQDKVYLASFVAEDRYGVRDDVYKKEIRFENRHSKQLNMFQIYPQLPEICRELDIQAVYFRIMALSWVTDRLFRELKQQGIKIVVEIPTYPFWKEKWMDVIDCFKKGNILSGLKRSGTNIVYWLYTHRLKKYIQAIVTFSDIDRLWGCRVIGIANGYHFEIPATSTQMKAASEPLNLLMVASIRDNHGADRIIRGMAEYYNAGGNRNILFHIVGDGEAIPKLKALAEEAPCLKGKIIFHGFRSGSRLDEIYSVSDIGISALGFHRIGVHYCSPLKSKEYFAKGLPIIVTTAEKDILSSECCRFCFEVPEDDAPVDIRKVIAFYDGLREEKVTDTDIIKTASQYFDWKTIMLPVYRAMAEE